MKTLYEILEVSETASDEIIEKAYRVLVKKYHPDLQATANKIKAEGMMKEINEAYEVLRDEQKRKEYDAELARKREEERQKAENKQEQYQPTSNNLNTDYEYNKAKDMELRKYKERLKKQEEKMKKQMEQKMQNNYEEQYYEYLRGLGYNIKKRWTWGKTKALFLTIIILIIIGTILWFIPPTHDMLVSFYESNSIVKTIVDIIGKIIQTFGEWISEATKWISGNK